MCKIVVGQVERGPFSSKSPDRMIKSSTGDSRSGQATNSADPYNEKERRTIALFLWKKTKKNFVFFYLFPLLFFTYVSRGEKKRSVFFVIGSERGTSCHHPSRNNNSLKRGPCSIMAGENVVSPAICPFRLMKSN